MHTISQINTLNQADKNHSWHPFTPMKQYLKESPIHIESALGCWLQDTNGNCYLDGCASNWTCLHGHNHPKLLETLHTQANKLCHSTYKGMSHTPGANLNELLTSIAPTGLTRVFYTDNGSCAIETAIKASFRYWQLIGQSEKKEAISMSGAYHGDTFGSMSVSDSPLFHEPFYPWCFPCHTFTAPICHEYNNTITHANDSTSLTELTQILETHASKIAFLIIEPSVQGPAGMRFQPKGFLKKVATLCKQYNVHLILDEIFVSFGRLGKMFACEIDAISPDILCVAKGLTAGVLPLAATLFSESIYHAYLGELSEKKTFYHGHTFSGHPLAAAVAHTNILMVQELLASGKLESTINNFGNKIALAFENNPHITAIRQRGMIAAISIKMKNNDPSIGYQVWKALKNKGILLRPLKENILMIPPLVIDDFEMDLMINTAKSTINKLCKQS